MPRGMLLRSPYVASNIADPERALTLDDYSEQTRRELLDSRSRSNTSSTTAAGSSDQALPRSRTRPPHRQPCRAHERAFPARASGRRATERAPRRRRRRDHAVRLRARARSANFHRSWSRTAREHRDLGLFRRPAGHRDRRRPERARVGGAPARGRRRGRGARPCRPRSTSSAVRRGLLHRLGPSRRRLFAPAEVGPAGISRLVSAPDWYRRLPRAAARPLGAPLASSCRRRLAAAATGAVSRSRSRARSSAQTRSTEGSSAPRRRLACVTPTMCCSRPATGSRSRSTVPAAEPVGADRPRAAATRACAAASSRHVRPALHFLGAPSAWSYGPLMRFVAGTEFAAPTLTRAVLGRRRAATRRS